MRTDLHGLLTRALRALRDEPKTKNQWTREQAIRRARARQDLFKEIGNQEMEMRLSDECPRCAEISCRCLPSGSCVVFTIGETWNVCESCGLSYEAHSKFAGAR
jgi:hypothetical protein